MSTSPRGSRRQGIALALVVGIALAILWWLARFVSGQSATIEVIPEGSRLASERYAGYYYRASTNGSLLAVHSLSPTEIYSITSDGEVIPLMQVGSVDNVAMTSGMSDDQILMSAWVGDQLIVSVKVDAGKREFKLVGVEIDDAASDATESWQIDVDQYIADIAGRTNGLPY